MNRVPICLLVISFLLLHSGDGISAVEDGVKHSLISFLAKLNGSATGKPDPSFGWVESTDPCLDSWLGISCDVSNKLISRIRVSGLDLSGVFDPATICTVEPLVSSLTLINLQKNQIGGRIPEEVSNCTNLTHLLIGKNNFSGRIPNSIVELKNLNKLDLSHNGFSGDLPDLAGLPELTVFTAQGNHFTGPVPSFNFLKLQKFDVSHNNFTGQIPDVKGKFYQNSFQDNPELCGPPLPKPCLSSNIVSSESKSDQQADDGESKKGAMERNQILMYSGYTIVGFGVISFVIFWMCKRKRINGHGATNKKGDMESRVASVEEDSFVSKESSQTSHFKDRSEGLASSSLVVLTSPVVNGLDFEELLKAPAELLGRGKHGSLYRVNLNSGMTVVVKRIKDWPISSADFKDRMERVHQASHRNVLPTLAFYCSRHEKLLVYGYQENGSLFRYLHGTKMGQAFDWGNRLSAAATIAEALAFMHKNLYDDSISHGNLKSSNILLNQNLEACISEYGLMPAANAEEDGEDYSSSSSSEGNSFSFSEAKKKPPSKKRSLLASDAAFKADVYGFGVILLELLTGKTVQNNGISLPTWVQAVVREEWTVEVFDKHLVSEGANEERMVNVLQVAIRCTSQTARERPSIKQAAVMINAIRDEEERSATASY